MSKTAYEKIRDMLRPKPQEVHGVSNILAHNYYQYLLNIVKGRFNIWCPRNWSVDYLLDALLLDGYFVVTDTDAGVLPLIASLHGINVFNRPNAATIANPILGTFERTLGVDAELVYLYNTGAMEGISSILDSYAYKLAAVDAGIDVNLINCKAAMIFDCADSKQAGEAKRVYERIASGEPAVFYSAMSGLGKDQRLNFYTNNVKNTFITTDLQDAKRTIMNEFLTWFGIKSANTDKRERLITAEVEANDEEIVYTIAYINRNLQECCNAVNRMFDIGLSIRMMEDIAYVEPNSSGATMGTGQE